MHIKIDSATIHVSEYSLPQFISSLKNSRQGIVYCGPITYNIDKSTLSCSITIEDREDLSFYDGCVQSRYGIVTENVISKDDLLKQLSK